VNPVGDHRVPLRVAAKCFLDVAQRQAELAGELARDLRIWLDQVVQPILAIGRELGEPVGGAHRDRGGEDDARADTANAPDDLAQACPELAERRAQATPQQRPPGRLFRHA